MPKSKRTRDESFGNAARKVGGIDDLSDDPIEVVEDDVVFGEEMCSSVSFANASNGATSRFPKRANSMNPFVYLPIPASSIDVDDIPPTEPFIDEDQKS